MPADGQVLDDTLVHPRRRGRPHRVCQRRLTEEINGRHYHPRAFTIWMAGGGSKAGTTHGETDDFAFNIVKDRCTSTTCTSRCCTCSTSTARG